MIYSYSVYLLEKQCALQKDILALIYVEVSVDVFACLTCCDFSKRFSPVMNLYMLFLLDQKSMN